MTVEKLINIIRLGRQLTPAQSRAVITQLERIHAMERTLAAMDHDFAQLSVAYSSARAECERLKEAVRWFLECAELKLRFKIWFVTEPEELEARATYQAALKAVE